MVKYWMHRAGGMTGRVRFVAGNYYWCFCTKLVSGNARFRLVVYCFERAITEQQRLASVFRA